MLLPVTLLSPFCSMHSVDVVIRCETVPNAFCVWIQKSFALFCNETVASCECQEHRIREHVASLIDTDDDDEDEESTADSVICPAHLVGYVVGRNGQTMKYLREQTNTRIYIEDAHVEGMRRIVVQGAHSIQTERAKQMIYSILSIGCSEMSCAGKGICQVHGAFVPRAWLDGCDRSMGRRGR